MGPRAVLVGLLVGALSPTAAFVSGEAARTIPQDQAIKSAATITAAELRARLRFLASDELEGRAVGHRGNAVAARYLATALDRVGVRPATDGFYQDVELYTGTLGSGNLLTLAEKDGKARVETPYRVGDDFVPDPVSAVKSVTAPVAFVGFGITAPDFGYDDYAGINVQGHALVMLQHEPGEKDPKSRFAGTEMTRHAEIQTKLEAARRHGAVAILFVSDASNHPGRTLRPLHSQWPDKPSPRTTHYELRERVDSNRLAVAHISIRAAEQLLEGDGTRTVEALQKTAEAAAEQPDRSMAPASFVVSERTVTLSIDIERQPVNAPNVLGIIEGRDASVRDEVVVIGAHYDHDGVDSEGRIYNGADDDGSGTVTVLEVAEAFAHAAESGTRPRRTVVFALWNAEEKGLFGSEYFATHVVPAGSKVVANVNLDMVGRNEEIPESSGPRFAGLPKRKPEESANAVHLLGYSYSPELAAIVKEENAALGLVLRTEYDTGTHALIRRSDHWPFLAQGIPAVFITTGLHPDYHTPQDDVEKINFAKMEKIARLCYGVLWRLAEADELPRYVNPHRTATEP